VSVELSTTSRQNRVTVEFTRRFAPAGRLVGGRFHGKRYALKGLENVERVYTIVNHPLATVEMIDAGTYGDLLIDVDVSGLQDSDL